MTLGFRATPVSRAADYKVKTLFDPTYGEIQVFALVDSDGNAVDLATLLSSPLTAQTPTFTKSTVSTEKQIVATNANRKGGYIQALWLNSDNIYLRLDATATTTDIPLAPGGQFMLTLNYGGPPITNEVRGIAGSGTQGYIVVEA